MIKRFLIFTVTLLCSCAAHKNIPYLVNSNFTTDYQAQECRQSGVIEIKRDDILSIEICTSNPKGAEPFNISHLNGSSSGKSSSINIEEKTYGYLVDDEGNIDFPVVGKLKVAGLSNIEASELIRESLSTYLKERPTVRIRIINFQISILGEVATPGVIEIDSERINIFEALALAGDMTLYGERDNVKIIREMPNGRSKVITLNLQDRNIVESEYYYLQQSDIIYVQPNRSKANTSAITASSTIWITFTSALISIASFVLAFVM